MTPSIQKQFIGPVHMPPKLHILNRKAAEITIPVISALSPGLSQAFSQPNILFIDIFLQYKSNSVHIISYHRNHKQEERNELLLPPQFPFLLAFPPLCRK